MYNIKRGGCIKTLPRPTSGHVGRSRGILEFYHARSLRHTVLQGVWASRSASARVGLQCPDGSPGRDSGGLVWRFGLVSRPFCAPPPMSTTTRHSLTQTVAERWLTFAPLLGAPPHPRTPARASKLSSLSSAVISECTLLRPWHRSSAAGSNASQPHARLGMRRFFLQAPGLSPQPWALWT